MSEPFGDVFAGKSVFVTGHTGFKGAWLCMWLARLGANVTGYALAPPTTPSHFEISEVADLLTEHHVADIRDASKLHAALRSAQPDVILHLAAQSVVRESYRTPRETFDVNVLGVASLLDGVRDLAKPCAVVAVTSDKCYQNFEQVWGYRESDPMGDYSPYGGSKGAAELLIRSYRRSFFPPERLEEHGVRLASARAGNVVGGGDWTPDALIVDLVGSVSRGEPARLRNPSAVRPWQHVTQALSGYLTLAARLLESPDPTLCSGWNFGPLPGNELAVGAVADLFLEEWKEGSWVDVGDPAQPHEANILRLSIDKALWRLDWTPQWDVYRTLQETARWYRRFDGRSESMRAFGLEQIAAYQDSMTGQDNGGQNVGGSRDGLDSPEAAAASDDAAA